MRHRKEEKTTGEDLDALLKHHQATQEKVSEEMMLLARSLKEQSQLANQIIKKDVEVLMCSRVHSMDKWIKLYYLHSKKLVTSQRQFLSVLT